MKVCLSDSVVLNHSQMSRFREKTSSKTSLPLQVGVCPVLFFSSDIGSVPDDQVASGDGDDGRSAQLDCVLMPLILCFSFLCLFFRQTVERRQIEESNSDLEDDSGADWKAASGSVSFLPLFY